MSLVQTELDKITTNLAAMTDADWNSHKATLQDKINILKNESKDQLQEIYDAEEAARPRE